MNPNRKLAKARPGRLKQAALAAGLCLMNAVCAQGAEVDNVKTGQVVVSATRVETELRDVPSSVSVVTSEDIERQPGSTVADLLKDIPGVQVLDQSVAGVKRVTIRGESPSRVLILVDGQKVGEQKSMDGSMILMDLNDVERVEVIKGPASVLHGSEAIGGVVNIITKKGGKKALQLSAAETFDGSANALTEYLSAYGGVDGWSYRVSGSYTDAGNRYAPGGPVDDSGYLSRNFSAYVDKVLGKAKVGLRAESFWSKEQVPPATSAGTVVELNLPAWTRDKVSGFVELKDLGENLSKLALNAYLQTTYKDFFNYVDPPGPVSTSLWTKNWQDSKGVSLQSDWTLGSSHYVIAGVEATLEDLKARDHKIVRPAATDTTYTNKAHQNTYAAFVQDQWSISPDWTLTMGLRETIVQSELDSTQDPGLRPVTSSGNRPVGSVGLVYSGFKDWRLRAQAAQGYRFPNLQQLYIGTVHGSTRPTYPNANLKAETSNSYEVGARYGDGAWTMDAATFYSKAEDYIATVALTGTTSQFDNVSGATTYGGEFSLEYLFDSWNLTPYAVATYLRRQFDTNTYKTSQTGDPSLFGRYGLRWFYDIDKTTRFTTDAYSRQASTAKEFSSGTFYRYNNWQTYNLALGLDWGAESKYRFSLNLNNLSNEKYTEANSALVSPGFHAVVRLGADF